MKRNIKEIVLITLLIIPAITLAYFWNQIPDTVPMHWNGSGEIDRYGPKSSLIWINILLGPFMYVLLKYITKVDPRWKNASESQKNTYDTVRLAIGLFIAIITTSIILVCAGFEINSFKIAMISVMGLFVIIGNFMPKFRSNHLVGIRTPATLEDDSIWKKTNMLGGKIFFWSGLIGLVAVFFLPTKYAATPLILVLGGVGFIVFYSFKMMFAANKKEGTES